ncbi:phosphoribosyl-AMP cyclohydrolase [soil metagenome]
MSDDAGRLDTGLRARVRFSADGLVPAIVQDATSGAVLMLGWMDAEALHDTLTTGRATFFSRRRQRRWVKGETSGNRQWVREVRLDCDGDTLLVRVDADGPACHTGAGTCFDADALSVVEVARQQRPQSERGQ